MDSRSRIRPAVPSDAGAIAEVHVRAWQAAYKGLLPEALLSGLSVERRAEVWSRLLADPSLDTRLAEDAAGTVVGFANLAASRDPNALPATGEITSIYVDPSHWGRGCGRALLAAALEAARCRGFRLLTLWVLRDNHRAIRFYERAGFAPDGAEKSEERAGGILLRERRFRLELPEDAG